MAEALTATNSPGEQQPFGASGGAPQNAVVGTNEGSNLQQTRSSEALGVRSKSPSPVPDDNLMEFLQAEASGTVHDTDTATTHDYHTAIRIGVGALALVLMALMLIFYKRLIHRILDPNYRK